MSEVVRRFLDSGLTLDELGRLMGSGEKSARKAASRFVYHTHDPHISTLRRFCAAVCITFETFVRGAKKRR